MLLKIWFEKVLIRDDILAEKSNESDGETKTSNTVKEES